MVARDFSKLGLKTAPGLDGYFQRFQTTTRIQPDGVRTLISFADDSIHPGAEMTPLRFSAEKITEGPLAFVGYGESDPGNEYDDFAGIDIKGKIVLIMRFDPSDPKTGNSRFADAQQAYSPHAALQEKVKAAVAHGAAGVIFVNPPLHHGADGMVPFVRNAMFNASVPVVQVTPITADHLLKAAGAPILSILQDRIDSSAKPASTPLDKLKVKLAVAFDRVQKDVQNVVGIVPGAGPTADEYVVVCGHYDHLGHGGANSLAPWSHAIHHGADDNASGTTAVLELADHFAHQPPPARSILFITFTAEEEGLIGSEYFVTHPPVPLDQLVGVLNLDMVGRVKDNKLLVGGMGTAEPFTDMLNKADAQLATPLKLGVFGKGGMGPSDHMSFAMKKIPVLFFYDDMMIDYHRPTDTSDKINFEGLSEVVDLGAQAVTAMTRMPRQQYNSSYDSQGLTQMGVGRGPGGGGASLGVVPDYSQGEEATDGVRISGTVPGSAAEKAGLKDGDIIVQFGDKKIDNLIDLTNALAAGRPGQRVKIIVKRNGKPVNIDATLTERRG
jgi:hypothetical protein